MEHVIRQYSLDSGAPEAEYIEEYFTEFRQKKTAQEIEEFVIESVAMRFPEGLVNKAL